jgi:hypothetical protein
MAVLEWDKLSRVKELMVLGQLGQIVGCQMSDGPNLMAGLDCYSFDVNNNSLGPPIDLHKLTKKCETITSRHL